MPFTVAEEFRTNRLSKNHRNPYSVFVRQPNNSVREYNNVKYPDAFMNTVKKQNPKGTEIWSAITK